MVKLRNLYWVVLPVIAAVRGAAPIPTRHIITLQDGLSSEAVEAHVSWAFDIHNTSLSRRDTGGIEDVLSFGKFNAYIAEFDEATLEQISGHPDVAHVEQDKIIHLSNDLAASDFTPTVQHGADWGLASLSSAGPGGSEYLYDAPAGADTYAYVIDTGCRTSHADFGGRAIAGANIAEPGAPVTDNYGHGTHVAGIIAGAQYGVAKQSAVVCVKMWREAAGLMSDAMRAAMWAALDIRDKGRERRAVINMSFGGEAFDAFDAAVDAMFDHGILSVAAGGNFGRDEALSPGRARGALAVGAVDPAWRYAAYSNRGAAIDVAAPGSEVRSAGHLADDAERVLSGTSMAVPFVSGVALYLMAREGAEALASPAAVRLRILELATRDAIQDLPANTVNLVVSNGKRP
ncbi:peptidase S8/S53 domain-containing protein [Xylariaceae sp. FL0804]|nr:peptidase S8/S53 domain-containing protein [Xylariaceae sp. FL0804]